MTENERLMLVRLETKIDILIARDDDKETRMRSIEKWRYALPTSMAVALASVVAQILPLIQH
jgi:hypothetical protein